MRIFLVLALIGAACGAVSRQPSRIVGGEATDTEKYPFMSSVAKISTIGFEHFCGGTLITNTAVVSAAHCYFDELAPASWRVRLGSHLANSGGDFHTVSRLILHEEFDDFLLTNDVAIIKLTHPAVFSNKIKTARIAGPHYILPDNTLVHVVGWGDTETGGSPSEVLQHVAVYTINQKLCKERYGYVNPEEEDIFWVRPGMFCTGILDVGGKDGCQGDSGGPLVHGGDVLVGITSWGSGCGDKFYPGVNVLVSLYADWIFANSSN